MRILGIDPGLRTTGFGLIDTRGDAMRYVASGVIRSGEGQLPERLGRLHQGIIELVKEYRPTVAVCEIVFVNVNPKSTLLLGQARGAAIGAMVSTGLPVHEYTALQIKQAVVGYGRATKEQVQEMVKRILTLPGLPSTDAADALACAICHNHGGPVIGSLGRRLRAGRVLGGTDRPDGPAGCLARLMSRRWRIGGTFHPQAAHRPFVSNLLPWPRMTDQSRHRQQARTFR